MLDLPIDFNRIEVPHLNPSDRFKILQSAQCGKGFVRHGKTAGGRRHPVLAV